MKNCTICKTSNCSARDTVDKVNSLLVIGGDKYKRLSLLTIAIAYICIWFRR